MADLENWLQAQLQIHGIQRLDHKQLAFIVPYLYSPLNLEELKSLFQVAHAAARGENPELSLEQGATLLKLLDEQSPKESSDG